MRTRLCSAALAAAIASTPYAAAFMPSVGLRLSRPFFRLPAWRPPDACSPRLWPNGAATSQPRPFVWRPGAAVGKRPKPSRLFSSSSSSGPWSDGELEREYEEQARLLKELDGGRVVFGEDDDWGVDLPPYNQRPDWAPSWVPTWAVTLPPLAQGAVTLVLYFLHMLVLSKVVVPFPVQVLPNKNGLFQSIGLDSLAGLAFLAVTAFFRKQQGKPAFPDVFNTERRLPFSPPAKARSGWRMLRILLLLVTAYITSGSASQAIEETFKLSAQNVALGRAVQVLAGHLVWVFTGVLVLHLNNKPFFGRASRWMRSSVNTYWLWWAIGGYYVSSLAFHISDTVNQLILPPSAFDVNSVVTQMINPEGNDVLAMAVGSIAPCLSAPWWEEVLYRGFLLPALYLVLPPGGAAVLSAVIFAAHHMSLSGMIPLATLGFLWAVLYVLSGNLLVPILIHCLWNSRVFLGSYWGV